MIKSKIHVPLLNANEPVAHLVSVHVRDGQVVEKGAQLFTIETTKATTEIEALETGFVRILVKEGAILAVGDLLALITDTAEERMEAGRDNDEHGSETGTGSFGFHHFAPEGNLRITKPARALAESFGMDLTKLPNDRLVTEEIVRQFMGGKLETSLPASDKPFILIYGGGGHAKSVMEIVLQNGVYTIAGIVDDDQNLTGKQVLGFPVLGTRMLLPLLTAQGVKLVANGVGGIIDIDVRVSIFELLERAGFSFPVLIHPHATVESSAKVGEGVQVFANAYIGSEAFLHPRCMINTNAVVSHDCTIGAYTHIAPGALLAGNVHVGRRTLVGMGVTTAIGVQIGDGVRIGNGANLLVDVPDKTIIQAGRFWTGIAGTA